MKRYIRSSYDSYDFDKFSGIIRQYLPNQGQGHTRAAQIVTAVNRLIYRWFNDGDVYDNVHGMYDCYGEDLSNEANWLSQYCPPATKVLKRIYDADSDSAYETILYRLATACLDAEDLEAASQDPSMGSIYDCRGEYAVDELDDEDFDDEDPYAYPEDEYDEEY